MKKSQLLSRKYLSLNFTPTNFYQNEESTFQGYELSEFLLVCTNRSTLACCTIGLWYYYYYYYCSKWKLKHYRGKNERIMQVYYVCWVRRSELKMQSYVKIVIHCNRQ